MKPVTIIQNWASEGPGHLRGALDDLGMASRVIKSFEVDTLPEPAESEALILLGTPISVRDYAEHEYLKRLFAMTAASLRHGIPTLGICFGGQLLATVLGARVERNPVREIGVYPARLTEAGAGDPLMAGFERDFNVFHWHNDTFRVPHGAQLLVQGETCANQLFRKGRAVAVQFHLEVAAEDVPRWCEEYADELAAEGKTADELIAQFQSHADDLHRLNKLLLGNFFSIA